MIKTCSKCGESKDQTEWHGRQCAGCLLAYRREWTKRSQEWLKGNRAKHSVKTTARAVKWNQDNPERRHKIALAYYYRLQDAAIIAYGGYRCACCGETERFFLTLDHINNDGGKFRKETGFLHHGAKFYKWLKDHGYPSGYQVLCSNCNHGKHRNHGICPHRQKT